MNAPRKADTDVLATRHGVVAFTLLIVAVFLALRIALLVARDPFYDELFTAWIVRKDFAGILTALRADSGPPLYYFVAHALGLTGVSALRVLSLVFATATIVLVASVRRPGNAHLVAASLLAVHPPSVLFAVDARAYAMAALCVAGGILLAEKRRLPLAAVVFVLGAYSHYYAVLFFPVLLLPAGWWPENHGGTERSVSRWFAFGLALLLFVPGFWLAFQQPRAAIQWMESSGLRAILGLSWAAPYPASLFDPAPIAAAVVSLLILAAALLIPALKDPEVRRDVRGLAVATLLPLAGAMVMGVYFPMRFESVIAVPLALWVGVSVERAAPWLRRVVILALVVIGLATVARGIVDHAERPQEDYRRAALWVAKNVPPSERVVATGYLYLETVMAGRPDAAAFPDDQAIHPGWRALSRVPGALPRGTFVWIGERGTREEAVVLSGRRVEPLFVTRRAMVARVTSLVH